MAKRDNYSTSHRNHLLGLNAGMVRRRWPSEFNGKVAHYMCENCRFVHDDKSYFAIDHIQPCAQGGTANRVSADEQQRIAAGDLEQLYKTGVNSMVLCRNCNGRKWKNDFIPEQSGYAHVSPYRQMDRNPDHIFYGGPLSQ